MTRFFHILIKYTGAFHITVINQTVMSKNMNQFSISYILYNMRTNNSYPIKVYSLQMLCNVCMLKASISLYSALHKMPRENG